MVDPLQPARKLQTLTLQAVDAEIGRPGEFYFEHPGWTIRYLVARTGWLNGGGRVVISPVALGGLDEEEGAIHVQLTREQIEHAPAIGRDGPPSRQEEVAYYRYFGWPPYWHAGPSPAFPASRGPAATAGGLLLSSEVEGYSLHTDDGELGRVRDFIVDTQYWAVRYLEVDTRAWLPGRQVLISPAWVGRIDRPGRSVRVELARRTIESAPDYRPDMTITRDYEVRLFGHYGRGAYWQRDVGAG
jgi:hypothetical protein